VEKDRDRDRDRDQVEEIRKRVDAVELISRYVTLRQSGDNYKGVCPFHEDNDPSLTVDPQKKLWHCFGCGAGGDIFKFLMRMENLSFRETLEELARETGVELNGSEGGGERTSLARLNKEVRSHFHRHLTRESVGKKARDYLQARGYGLEMAKRFKLGYALPGWRSLTNRFRGEYGLDLLEEGGLTKRSDEGRPYDRFRDRLIFPITSSSGQVIAFGGRRLEEEAGPKYLNSPNTPLFTKGHALYGLDVARHAITDKERAILVEGYTDVLAPQSVGIENVLASMGTSLTEEQAELLRRYAEEIVIAYDRDGAGERATLKSMRLLRNKGLAVKVAQLPQKKDPADVIEEGGKDEFLRLIEEAVPFHDFYLQVLEDSYDLSSVEGRERALRDSESFLEEIESPPLRHELIRRLKDLLDLPERELEDIFQRGKGGRYGRKKRSTDADGSIAEDGENEGLNLNEWLIRLALEDKITAQKLKEEGLLRELDPQNRFLVEKVSAAREEGRDLGEIMDELDEEEENLLARISLADVPFKEEEIDQASTDVIKRIKNKKSRQRLRALKRELKEKIAQGASNEELEEIQREILEEKRGLEEVNK